MWSRGARVCSTPPPNPRRYGGVAMIPQSAPAKRISDNYHKVPTGDSPYAKAKHVQLIDKDPSKAISLFWAAINSGDRVDSALKDMAIVMKQLDRSDEAIEAIKSFRHLCPHESQEPIDNILLELYKRSGRIEDQIKMLEIKLKRIEEGFNFGGKRVKPARSQGKKIYMSIEQEYSRLLGNLAWAYMQNNNFKSAEEHYRKALSLEPDKNKQCNLAICLMNMKRITEAKLLLQTIKAPTYENGVLVDEESYAKSLERATDMLTHLELNLSPKGACRGLLTPGVLQTQPRRCSINGGDQRKSFLGDDGRCAPRKLAFGENIEGFKRNGAQNEEKVGKNNGNCFLTPNSKKNWAEMVDEEGKTCGEYIKGFKRNGTENEEKVGKNNGNCFLTPNSKKNWADMVEEEEKSSFSLQTQPSGAFKNENLNSNPMGFRGNSNLVSSPVNFVEDERIDKYYDCRNGIKILKSSSQRLQVFKDITSSLNR